MYYTVYKITNAVNGKIYIGVHRTGNLNDEYMGSGKLVKLAQEKYGIENFTREYLQVFDNAEDMFKMESELVNEEFVARSDTYNLNLGGCGGWNHCNTSENAKKWRTAAQEAGRESYLKRFNEDEDFRNEVYDRLRRNSEWSLKLAREKLRSIHGSSGMWTFSNRTHSDEAKLKISKSIKGKQIGEKNSQFGSMWIHSLTEKVSKKIDKDEFSEWEAKGWLKGRKMKFL